ncbi:MAG: response regulator transcription factor [Mycobacterium sp.]
MSYVAAQIPLDDSCSKPSVAYIVDDEPSVRESLQFLLGGIGVKTEAFESPRVFLEQYVPGTPGCLILDLRLPEMTGFDVLDHMRERHIDLPTIVLTGYATVPLTVRAMHAGAIDVFEKPHADQSLLEGVQHAFAVDRIRRRERAQQQAARVRIDRLSPRQRQVAELMVEGQPTKNIADELRVAVKTIEAHRKAVMDKTGTGSVAELVRIWNLASHGIEDDTTS